MSGCHDSGNQNIARSNNVARREHCTSFDKSYLKSQHSHKTMPSLAYCNFPKKIIFTPLLGLQSKVTVFNFHFTTSHEKFKNITFG